MRILSVHNRYQIRGGEDESREAEERLLRDRGHHVDVYEQNNEKISELGKVQVALRTIWSHQTYRSVRKILQNDRYDLIHVQNFFPLISPSVYYAAASVGVPVVQTLRNYRLLCPNAQFFREGKICEDCMGKTIPLPGIVRGCYRGNRAGSAAVAAMIATHRGLGTWTKMVDCYIAISQFAKAKLLEGGLPEGKMVVKPNFVAPDPGIGTGSGGYALFVGRLSHEKGLGTLLDAWKRLSAPIPLKIVGEGPKADEVRQLSQAIPQVEWLGRQPLAEVYRLMGEARFLVFPSEWYETFGRVAVEAFAKGTPAIAANIGAISELVDPGRTGLLFQPGDAADLARQVEWILDRPEEGAKMRAAARAEFEAKYTEEENYHQLIRIYQQVLASRQNREHRAIEVISNSRSLS
ncbi:glycosyltransferase [Oscillatoriales cyanobacterium LEGE 11467]|uniref:Glycosyltransferase n=2 Tax=Zarconia TaxID=2992130 RepID=A0A928W0N0_9CYAN|nr:glycosyltransferase [Zarconia navalis LEGE 11467]